MADAELTYFTKDPDEILDYEDSWAKWLKGDTIVGHVVTAEDGITVETSSASEDTVTYWLSGGTEGATYAVTDTIETAGGRTAQRTSKIRIRNR